MRLWTVHEPRNLTDLGERADKTIFVKDGFSWPAFIVPLPWLLVKRLWLGTLLYVLIAVAAGLAGSFLPLTGDAGMLLALIANLYAGLEGNDLIRRKLVRRGLTQAGSVLAKTRDEAEILFFTARDETSEMSVPERQPARAPSRVGGDVLGLFPEPGGAR
jgi:hypothetical protein